MCKCKRVSVFLSLAKFSTQFKRCGNIFLIISVAVCNFVCGLISSTISYPLIFLNTLIFYGIVITKHHFSSLLNYFSCIFSYFATVSIVFNWTNSLLNIFNNCHFVFYRIFILSQTERTLTRIRHFTVSINFFFLA